MKKIFNHNGNSFKPYYNWNTFNTKIIIGTEKCTPMVLNLIITGIPSIHKKVETYINSDLKSFKPYYNWNTFNTL